MLRRSPEVTKIFSLIDHRSVPTIYPPLSEAVFAATAFITPERAPVRVQVGGFKGVLLLFDLATVLLVMGLLRNLNQPPARTLAYAWCPLVLKEFANTGHLDAIAVCLSAAVFWLLTLPRRENNSASAVSQSPMRPQFRDWLAVGLWAGAVLAKLYPRCRSISQPVIQKPQSDESAPSRTRRSLDSITFGFRARAMSVVSARQLKRRVCAYGWCRAQMHTRKE